MTLHEMGLTRGAGVPLPGGGVRIPFEFLGVRGSVIVREASVELMQGMLLSRCMDILKRKAQAGDPAAVRVLALMERSVARVR